MACMMEGLDYSIGSNSINGPAAQFCDVDDAPIKKAAWDQIIFNAMGDSNGRCFEFSVVTDYSMTNFCYQLRPDMDNVELLIVTYHNIAIKKKGLTKKTLLAKK
jgi:hypothetical protein